MIRWKILMIFSSLPDGYFQADDIFISDYPGLPPKTSPERGNQAS